MCNKNATMCNKIKRLFIPYLNLSIRLGRTTGMYALPQKVLRNQVRSFSCCGMFFHFYVESSFSPQRLCVSLTLRWKGFAQETNVADFTTAALSIILGKKLSEDQKSLSRTLVLTTLSSDHSGPSMTLLKPLHFFAEGFQDTIWQQEASHRNGWYCGWTQIMALLSLKQGGKSPAGPQSSKLDIV